MTAFRDETLEAYTVSAEDRWGYEASPYDEPETLYRYVEHAQILADRLETMGYGLKWAMRVLDDAILESANGQR